MSVVISLLAEASNKYHPEKDFEKIISSIYALYFHLKSVQFSGRYRALAEISSPLSPPVAIIVGVVTRKVNSKASWVFSEGLNAKTCPLHPSKASFATQF